MTDREEFEAWVTAPPFERIVTRHGEASAWPGNYKYYEVEFAWCAWKDSRDKLRAALKEGE